jgi:CBS domain containing-hemolysin-like protein
MAFVVDGYGIFIGLVTFEDLLEDQLEEIVGEIRDETDEERSQIAISQIGPGRCEADGLVSLGDLSRVTGLVLPPGLDANTLSGLFMDRVARMPEPGG